MISLICTCGRPAYNPGALAPAVPRSSQSNKTEEEVLSENIWNNGKSADNFSQQKPHCIYCGSYYLYSVIIYSVTDTKKGLSRARQRLLGLAKNGFRCRKCGEKFVITPLTKCLAPPLLLRKKSIYNGLIANDIIADKNSSINTEELQKIAKLFAEIKSPSQTSDTE